MLREVFGEYRAPTGVAAAAGVAGTTADLRAVAERVKAMAGGPPRILVAKPGLDGHSNGAEQIAVAARDAGMEVDLPGHPPHPRADRRGGPRRGRRRSSASRSSRAATSSWCPRWCACCATQGVDAPVVVGGIIPEDDRPSLLAGGVAAVYTPKDFELGRIMGEIADLVAAHRA